MKNYSQRNNFKEIYLKISIHKSVRKAIGCEVWKNDPGHLHVVMQPQNSVLSRLRYWNILHGLLNSTADGAAACPLTRNFNICLHFTVRHIKKLWRLKPRVSRRNGNVYSHKYTLLILGTCPAWAPSSVMIIIIWFIYVLSIKVSYLSVPKFLFYFIFVLHSSLVYMEIGHQRGMIANEHIRIGSHFYEKVFFFFLFFVGAFACFNQWLSRSSSLRASWRSSSDRYIATWYFN